MQVADLMARVQGYEEGSVDKHSVTRLETKLRDYESRVELEQSQRQRLEVSKGRLLETQWHACFHYSFLGNTSVMDFFLLTFIFHHKVCRALEDWFLFVCWHFIKKKRKKEWFEKQPMVMCQSLLDPHVKCMVLIGWAISWLSFLFVRRPRSPG